MLWTIIVREMQEHLKSLKFQIGFLIMIVLLTIVTNINIKDFEQRNQDYLDAQEEMKGDVFYVRVYRAPEVLSVLVQGKDRKLGNKAEMTTMFIPARTSGYMGFESKHHQYLAGFEAVDFTFVVRIILSLLVIFLFYNTISGEKFQGTLKMVLANNLPRDKLLVGKFISGLIVIMSSFLIAAILSILNMIFHPSIALGDSELIRILMMIGVSILYVICFYTLSLFISVVVNRPAITLMVLLQIWIFLIIIIPNFGVIISENIYKLPEALEIAQQKMSVFEPYRKEYDEIMEALHKSVKSGEQLTSDYQVRRVELTALKTEMEHQVDVEFSNQLTNQAQRAYLISSISPAVLYDQVMLRFARTGLVGYEKFMDALLRHWGKHVERNKLRYSDYEAYRESKIPEFTYPKETLYQSFFAALPQLQIQFLFSVIFFVLAYITFLRKDVR